MYSVNNGANRSPSRVKCAKTSNFVKQQETTTSMAPIKPNSTTNNSNKEMGEQQRNGNNNAAMKHTFDKKGDWSLMTASRYAYALLAHALCTPSREVVVAPVSHTAACLTPCRGAVGSKMCRWQRRVR